MDDGLEKFAGDGLKDVGIHLGEDASDECVHLVGAQGFGGIFLCGSGEFRRSLDGRGNVGFAVKQSQSVGEAFGGLKFGSFGGDNGFGLGGRAENGLAGRSGEGVRRERSGLGGCFRS